MYYQLNDGYYLIFNHDLKHESLPFNGWFHNCIFCNSVTCNETIYTFPKYRIKLLLCKDCDNLTEINKFKYRIDKWIEKNII